MKIMFKPLPREPLKEKIRRLFLRRERDLEVVRVELNEYRIVIKRGEVVDVPSWVKEVIDHSGIKEHSYKIIKD